MEIKMNKVKSSNVDMVGYDEITKVMRIQFLDGRIYEYSGMPKLIYDTLKNSNSIGGYINRNLKTYSYKRIK